MTTWPELRAIRRFAFRRRHLRHALNVVRHRDIHGSDLFIASYPRSGTTWFRFLLFELLTGDPAEFVDVNRSIPYVGRHRQAPALLPPDGRVIQTHESHSGKIHSAIYLVRDPRSIVTSEFLWQVRTGLARDSFGSFFEAFIGGYANPYERWDRHVAGWRRSPAAQRHRLHVVRFEDLRRDTGGELSRLLRFLDIERDDAYIEDVVRNNALGEMRAKEARAPQDALGPQARPDIRFVGSGSTTAWKEHLRADHVRRIEEAFAAQMAVLGYEPTQQVIDTPRAHDLRGGTATNDTTRSADRPPVDVIYIAGWGRSGSTLLDRLLGQLDGFFSAGELRYLWERGVLQGSMCGCGRLVTGCPIWSSILEQLGRHDDVPDARSIVGLQQEVARFRRTAGLLLRSRAGLQQNPSVEAYVRVLDRLVATICDVTGARVLVDSSKRPSDAALLELVPSVRLHVIHLVRDPRGVAYSWRTHKPGIDQLGTLTSAAGWLTWNAASDALRRAVRDRSMVLRYEDFVEHPRDIVRSIAHLVGEDAADIPETDGRFNLTETHTVSGNPSRFRNGSVEITLDDQWVTGLSPIPRAAVTAISLPLLRRYGYPTRT